MTIFEGTLLPPDGHALGLEIAPPRVHLLQSLPEESGVLLAVQPADQFLPSAVQAEVHVPVVLNLGLQVLTEYSLVFFLLFLVLGNSNNLEHLHSILQP